MKVADLITDGLGYCCEYIFFHYYKDTSMIAARLGVTTRAIRKHKAAFAAGELRCENCKNCLCHKLNKAA